MELELSLVDILLLIMEVHVSIYKLVINSNLLMSIILISTFKLLLSLNLPAMNIDNFPSC